MNMSIYALIRGVFIAALMMVMSVSFDTAQAQEDEPLIPIIEWQKRQTSAERLTAYGDDLMGDSIDRHLGTLVFEHTDVSLSGNSNLEVAIRRRLMQGENYRDDVNVDFADWELLTPKISALVLKSEGWAGQRCSGSWEDNFPEDNYSVRGDLSSTFGVITAAQYTNGVSMDIPAKIKLLEMQQKASLNSLGMDLKLSAMTAKDLLP